MSAVSTRRRTAERLHLEHGSARGRTGKEASRPSLSKLPRLAVWLALGEPAYDQSYGTAMMADCGVCAPGDSEREWGEDVSIRDGRSIGREDDGPACPDASSPAAPSS